MHMWSGVWFQFWVGLLIGILLIFGAFQIRNKWQTVKIFQIWGNFWGEFCSLVNFWPNKPHNEI
jgi:hypothetical protein